MARCWWWSINPRRSALPVAVARAAGHQVAYLPGLAMRRIADLYPGRAKTDAKDAFIVTAILTAMDEQAVTVPGTAAADTVLPRLADSLKTVLQQRKQVDAEVEGILDAHPLAGVLTSMPGIGVRTAARILLEIGDVSSFASSAHLAA
ncbi:transposase [Actinokineospora baliensis]|nr:transposase [Actinokineospora baliensis]